MFGKGSGSPNSAGFGAMQAPPSTHGGGKGGAGKAYEATCSWSDELPDAGRNTMTDNLIGILEPFAEGNDSEGGGISARARAGLARLRGLIGARDSVSPAPATAAASGSVAPIVAPVVAAVVASAPASDAVLLLQQGQAAQGASLAAIAAQLERFGTLFGGAGAATTPPVPPPARGLAPGVVAAVPKVAPAPPPLSGAGAARARRVAAADAVAALAAGPDLTSGDAQAALLFGAIGLAPGILGVLSALLESEIVWAKHVQFCGLTSVTITRAIAQIPGLTAEQDAAEFPSSSMVG